MKERIKLVECARSPGLQYWGPGNTIYKECSCGLVFSFDTPGVKTHWVKYEVWARRPRGQQWDEFYLNCRATVERAREKYIVPDWTS